MASPQTEHGYIQIANEIVDQLCRYRISGEEWLVLWVIIRKTYGWNKPNDKISLSQFADMTNLKRPIAARAIKKLILRGVIKKDTTYITTYSFVKDYEKWKVVSKKILCLKKDTGGVSKMIPKLVSKKIHTKDTKETITKEKEIYVSIINHFNEIFKKDYKTILISTAIRKLISARLKEGFTLEDFKHVHLAMYAQWHKDETMARHMRPHTLYTGKFESYLNTKIPTKEDSELAKWEEKKQ